MNNPYPYRQIKIEKTKRNGNCQYCTNKASDLLLAFFDRYMKYGFSQAVPICSGCLARKEMEYPRDKGYYFATRNKGEFWCNMLDLFRTPYRGIRAIKDIPGIRFKSLTNQRKML